MPATPEGTHAEAATAPAPSAAAGDEVTLEVERLVAGGAGLGREPGGRVVLVEGALPAELVRARVTRSKPRMAQATLVDVRGAAAGRVTPPCPELHAGCGGCDLQHATPTLQREAKVEIVRDALARIARLADVPISAGEQIPVWDFRTVLRCGVADGRAGFHRRRSSELHPVDQCLIAHPLAEDIVTEGRFPGASEVTIRVGARTGERLVMVAPDARGVAVPDDVVVVGLDDPARALNGADPWIHEVVGRRRYRISARSFFQARPDGAEALVRAVGRAVGPFDPERDRLVDLYGGVGLFTGGLGSRHSVLVERSASAVRDARVNLAPLETQVVEAKVQRWSPTPADVVVADPARAGLGREGVAAVVGTGAERVALVSCDPASLARDTRLLVDEGYEVLGVELVDMFPQTHHVEAVTSLRRVGAA